MSNLRQQYERETGKNSTSPGTLRELVERWENESQELGVKVWWTACRRVCADELATALDELEDDAPMEQHDPIPNASVPVWELVIADMQARDRIGRVRYGTPLQAFNGRNSLEDAYAEALDLAVYLKQAIIEQDRLRSELAEAQSWRDQWKATAEKLEETIKLMTRNA